MRYVTKVGEARIVRLLAEKVIVSPRDLEVHLCATSSRPATMADPFGADQIKRVTLPNGESTESKSWDVATTPMKLLLARG